jgi:protein farnesyltransferase subunit beta
MLCHSQAAEYADQNAEIAAASAAVLYPCSGTPSPEDLYALLASPAAAAAAGEQDANASAPSNPLFNSRALQCWLLRACQQLKGGLRDKPGKSADYYHSCYCLSGLSTAQHIAGGGVVGPAQNVLPRVDPLLNVLAEKLQQAKAHFGALPKLPL